MQIEFARPANPATLGMWTRCCGYATIAPTRPDGFIVVLEGEGSLAWQLYANPHPVKYRAISLRFSRAARRSEITSERFLTGRFALAFACSCKRNPKGDLSHFTF